jgi:hypothetical protein
MPKQIANASPDSCTGTEWQEWVAPVQDIDKSTSLEVGMKEGGQGLGEPTGEKAQACAVTAGRPGNQSIYPAITTTTPLESAHHG